MQRKVTLIEYLNYVNDHNAPIGHGKKVLGEMAELVNNFYIIKLIASRCYYTAELLNQFDEIGLHTIYQPGKTIKEINREIFKNLIKYFLGKDSSDAVWFTNVDWHLFACLSVFCIRKKVIVTVYRDIWEDVAGSKTKIAFIKKALVKKGISKVDLFIVTNKKLQLSNKQIFVPDYIFDKKYIPYISKEKIDRVLCVGAMRKSKDLIGLISQFKNTDVPVYIVGGFQDKDWLNQLRGMCSGNIIVEDRVVPYDEYYRLIGQSRFTIMPYKMNLYKTATSGILQETIFLKTIPIAPIELLTYNQINGIGYKVIEELPRNLRELQEKGALVSNSLGDYEKKNVQVKIVQAINSLWEQID